VAEASERYLRRCQEILSSLDDAEAEAPPASANPTGRLRVHALSRFGHQLVVSTILQYQQRFSALRAEVTMTGTNPDMRIGRRDVGGRRPSSLCLRGASRGSAASLLCAGCFRRPRTEDYGRVVT
jgi:DNA-binding transcriptional LysR family regulator